MIGELIAGYRIVERLGGGSTGDVYAAEHASVGTKAAIKIIAPALAADPGRLQRYLRDAQAASRIANQGTVKITEVGMPAGYGHGFLVMELLHGETLAARIARSGRLSATQIAELARQVATVLASLHDDNLVHRDIRPDTIFLARDAGPGHERIKLLVGDALLLGPTHAKAVPYVAPEVWRGEPVDWRVDVYALGCTMFEMATGRPPYAGDDVAQKHVEHAIPAARSLMPDVPPALDALIARLVAKHVEQRPKSLREVARELDSVGGTARPLASTQQDRPIAAGEVTASPPPIATIAPSPARKRPLGIAVAVLLAIVVAIVVVVLLAGCRRARERCRVTAGESATCSVPRWDDRDFELHAPAAWDGKSPVPVVLLLHGGGGRRGIADGTTCPDGNQSHPSCFVAMATQRGFAVVMPDGTGSRRARNIRTWNGGGGGTSPYGELDCVSGRACAEGVDDIAYMRAVLDVAGRALPLDDKQIFAAGLSNGGAMSHRLACELPDRIAAIVSVGGGNQHAYAGGPCASGVAVMELHGTNDACWPYAGGGGDCISTRYKVSADDTMAAWARRNGCTETVVDEPLPDRDPNDGVTSTRRRWTGCARATELVRSGGAGHTWPNGHAYSERAGIATRDFGSELVLDFFAANPRP